MKYLFIALVYFSVGFAFPNFSPLMSILTSVFLLVFTLGIFLKLYDDRLNVLK